MPVFQERNQPPHYATDCATSRDLAPLDICVSACTSESYALLHVCKVHGDQLHPITTPPPSPPAADPVELLPTTIPTHWQPTNHEPGTTPPDILTSCRHAADIRNRHNQPDPIRADLRHLHLIIYI